MFDELFLRLRQAPAAQALLRRVESGGAFTCGGVTGSAHAFLAAWLRRELPHRPIVLVSENLKAQEVLHQDLETWLGGEGHGSKFKVQSSKPADATPKTPDARPHSLLFFPAWETLPHEDKLPHADVISERLETLVELMRSAECGVRNEDTRPVDADSALVTTSITALLQRTFPPAMLAQRMRTLRRGDRVDPLDLIEWLEDNGYDSEAQVSAKGDIALRGGIVDVFPLTSPWPVRLEFFGDELESLRTFDPVTQISRDGGEMAEIVLPPAGELGVLKQLRSIVAGFSLRGETEEEAKRNLKVATTEPLATLLDYLPDETIFLLCDPEAIEHHAGEYEELVPDNDPFFASWAELRGELLRRGLTVPALTEKEMGTTEDAAAHLSLGTDHAFLTSLEAFRPITERTPTQEVAQAQRREFFLQLQRWLHAGFAVHVVCNNDGESQRFGEVWRDSVPEAAVASAPTVSLGTLASGFLCAAAKFVVVTDAEIFGRYKVQRPRRMKSAHAIAARSALDIDFTELEEGDYVVHLQHGIGRFRGLKVLPTNKPGRERHHLDAEALRPEGRSSDQGAASAPPTVEGIECLVLEYAPSDSDREPPRLYVPITESHLISKYVGAGKMRPPLNTLGGKRWEKTKQQAERAVRDVAADLLAIQAKRATQPGHAFGPDTPWQREFESSFLYEETTDQLRAITETKHDLEIPKPMDRLICGDVGFGKTEVAIRAAFKAVMDGKQVAILVPTTVLAQQHYNTFRDRMADYPIRVELLSRFRTRKEQLKVVEQLAAGEVDIVVGTHRLVQSDVTFKDLGLVVIDEEQRFGVMHKEKFKLLRTHVDVLTLSATPIPRTLYLALTGART